MKYLLDTCVISEVIKRQPQKNVIAWLQNQEEESLYLSVLTIGEIEKGIKKSVDPDRQKIPRSWVEEDLRKRFYGRIISIDLDVSIKWGTIQGSAEIVGNPMPVIDGLIAASALVHGCTIVTRNISDMAQSAVELLDPWQVNL